MGLERYFGAACQASDVSLALFGEVPFRLASRGHSEGGDALIAVGENPTDDMRHALQIPRNREAVAFAPLHHEMNETLGIGLRAFDIENLFGIVALRLVEPLHARRIPGEFVQ